MLGEVQEGVPNFILPSQYNQVLSALAILLRILSDSSLVHFCFGRWLGCCTTSASMVLVVFQWICHVQHCCWYAFLLMWPLLPTKMVIPKEKTFLLHLTANWLATLDNHYFMMICHVFPPFTLAICLSPSSVTTWMMVGYYSKGALIIL